MKLFFTKLDKAICRTLGITKDTVKTHSISLVNNELIVKITNTFKRHQISQSWNDFCKDNIKLMNTKNKTKLGIAAGKLLANKLVVSFDAVKINKED